MMKAMIGDVVRVKRVDEDGKMYRCKATVMCVEEDGVMELLEGDKFSNRGKTMTRVKGDDVFFEASNDPDTRQEGYGLLNASVEYDVSKSLTLGLYGKNILDKEYLNDAGNTAGSLGYPTLIEGTPANWLLTARYTF